MDFIKRVIFCQAQNVVDRGVTVFFYGSLVVILLLTKAFTNGL